MCYTKECLQSADGKTTDTKEIRLRWTLHGWLYIGAKINFPDG